MAHAVSPRPWPHTRQAGQAAPWAQADPGRSCSGTECSARKGHTPPARSSRSEAVTWPRHPQGPRKCQPRSQGSGDVGSRGDDTTAASRNVPTTASAPQACSPGAGTLRAATPPLRAPGWGLSVCSFSQSLRAGLLEGAAPGERHRGGDVRRPPAQSQPLPHQLEAGRPTRSPSLFSASDCGTARPCLPALLSGS